MHNLFSDKKKSGSGQRKLRVGEEIRHIIAELLMRGEVHSPTLLNSSITVSEVRVSPDLKNATVYVMPLAGERKDELLLALKESSPKFRHLISKRLRLRYIPKLHFALDNSYEEAQRINDLLKNPDVAKDLKHDSDKGLGKLEE
ncbi:MAG: 30S ribosome-binding factor RbfA [Rickettsiales bacterium]